MLQINELKRERYKKLMNLLPETVLEHQAPRFFYKVYKPFVDFDSISLNRFEVEIPDRSEQINRFKSNVSQKLFKIDYSQFNHLSLKEKKLIQQNH